MPEYTFYGYTPGALSYDSGAGTITLDPAFDHTQDRIKVVITDDDNMFDGDWYSGEVGDDTNQTAVVTEPDGTPIASGAVYDEEYYEIAKPGGGSIWIERVEIGGQLVGYLVSEPLVPGTAYSAISMGNVGPGDDSNPDTRLQYSEMQSVPCFVAGSMIEVETGAITVEEMKPGMRARTLDNGFQPVIWTGSRVVGICEQIAVPRLRAVCLMPGQLGRCQPATPLFVSSQHRVLLRGMDVEMHFAEPEVFAPARGLAPVLLPTSPVSYHHILFESHQVVRANGCWVESLYPGPVAYELLGPIARLEITALLGDRLANYQLARPALTTAEARMLIARRSMLLAC